MTSTALPKSYEKSAGRSFNWRRTETGMTSIYTLSIARPPCPRVPEHGLEARLPEPSSCDRPHLTSKLPDGDFLLRAQNRKSQFLGAETKLLAGNVIPCAHDLAVSQQWTSVELAWCGLVGPAVGLPDAAFRRPLFDRHQEATPATLLTST
jgi:hypothetical protein